MSDHVSHEDAILDAKRTAAKFPVPSRDVADRLVDLLVVVEYASANGDEAA